MNRWSVSKIFTQVTAAEFRDAVYTMQHSMTNSCGTPMNVKINLYNRVPASITSYQEGVNEYLQRERLKMIFATVSSARELTNELWDKAVYVDATIEPADKDIAPAYAFGHIEAKGLKPKQICLYVQPEEAGELAMEQSLSRHKRWLKGDGMQSNHIVTYG